MLDAHDYGKINKKAYVESVEGRRQGDKIKEVKEIQKYILNAKI